MLEKNEAMVRYDRWCKQCKYEKVDENNEPCEECLENPINETELPLNFEEK